MWLYETFSAFSVEFSSSVWLFVTADCSTPGFPIYHRLPELAQTHVHCVSDVIQASYPLLSSSPAFNLSQHQGLHQWVSSSHQVAKVIGASASASVLPMNIQGWFPLGNLAISDALVLILHNVYFVTILWFFLLLPWPQKKTLSKLQFYKAWFILGRGKIKIDRRKWRGKGTDKAARGRGGKVLQGRESILMGSSTLNVLGPLRMSRDNRHDEYTFPKEGKAGNPGCEFISPIGILENME